jgi:outer membrane receptor for ferrienterochelin and colicins
MKWIVLPFLAIIYANLAIGQNIFKAIVKDSKTNEVIIGVSASLKGTNKGSSTDLNGYLVIENIPDGEFAITFRHIGYDDKIETIKFPLNNSAPVEILLTSHDGEKLEEVVISSTRSSRTIDNISTRIEVISGEEIDEKANMKPGDIRMLLSESTGIQTQQTSATSYNSSIRIQGLDGKYTQILRDGFPLYTGFSGGLSILQVAPLDLKQVEVIKGSSSTLYGGGAIAGLVNLISKTPQKERDLSFLLNGTSALGLDISGFYSQKFNKIGTTIFASYNSGTPYDPSNIGFTAIPKYRRYTVNPRLFVDLSDKTSFNIGFNSTIEDRLGGDMKYVQNDGDSNHSYFENNKTNRFSTQLAFEHKLNDRSKISFKNSVGFYDRSIEIPDYQFSGIQLSSFTEATFNYQGSKSEWSTGLNLWTDKFDQHEIDDNRAVDYNYTTLGGFIQNTWNATGKFIVETGLRTDYQDEYGFFALPRISALLKVNQKLSMRLGGGMGYKIPSVFTEDAERIQFRNVLPIDAQNINAEKSIGGNFDINYRTPLSDELFLSMNVLFFYTQLNNPLVLVNKQTNYYEFQQPEGYLNTKGIETNIKLTYHDFKLFVGYTLANVNQHYHGIKTSFPLVAQHRWNNVLMYELEDEWKIGLEAYYFSPQKLNDGSIGKDYWIGGFMVEKFWDRFSVFVNFENFLDARQTKFDTIYTGSITNPTFRDIYAPVDGFVVNGGLKIKL